MKKDCSKKAEIALILMPLYPIIWPSIQIGILKALLEKNGKEVEDFYLNLSFAKEISEELYNQLAMLQDVHIGDWLFSKPFNKRSAEGYLNIIKDRVVEQFQITQNQFHHLTTRLIYIRNVISCRWIEKAFQRHQLARYPIVGFSCTFSQVLPSLWMARLIKTVNKESKIIFGGKALDDSIGLEILKRNADVDIIVQGDGENALIECINDLKQKRKISSFYQSDKKTDLRQIPVPNYDSFFREVDKLSLQKKYILPIEMSRGCWWGEKKQCGFCAYRRSYIRYRSKDPETVLREIEVLVKKYKKRNFDVVDSIFNACFFKTFVPQLCKAKDKSRFLIEMKANVLTQDKIRACKDAGICWIQPGIETLDSHLLQLMNKGTRLEHNLTVLKWCQFYGITVFWNWLTYIPGESEEDYKRILDLVPKVFHFPPPKRILDIRLERHSPFFKECIENKKASLKRHFKMARPHQLYDYIYPSNWDKSNLSTFYNFYKNDTVSKSTMLKLNNLIRLWQHKWKYVKKPVLLFVKKERYGCIVDSRKGKQKKHLIVGQEFQVAKAFEQGCLSVDEISQDTGLSRTQINQAADQLEDFGLAYKINENRYYWLPMPSLL